MQIYLLVIALALAARDGSDNGVSATGADSAKKSNEVVVTAGQAHNTGESQAQTQGVASDNVEGQDGSATQGQGQSQGQGQGQSQEGQGQVQDGTFVQGQDQADNATQGQGQGQSQEGQGQVQDGTFVQGQDQADNATQGQGQGQSQGQSQSQRQVQGQNSDETQDQVQGQGQVKSQGQGQGLNGDDNQGQGQVEKEAEDGELVLAEPLNQIQEKVQLEGIVPTEVTKTVSITTEEATTMTSTVEIDGTHTPAVEGENNDSVLNNSEDANTSQIVDAITNPGAISGVVGSTGAINAGVAESEAPTAAVTTGKVVDATANTSGATGSEGSTVAVTTDVDATANANGVAGRGVVAGADANVVVNPSDSGVDGGIVAGADANVAVTPSDSGNTNVDAGTVLTGVVVTNGDVTAGQVPTDPVSSNQVPAVPATTEDGSVGAILAAGGNFAGLSMDSAPEVAGAAKSGGADDLPFSGPVSTSNNANTFTEPDFGDNAKQNVASTSSSGLGFGAIAGIVCGVLVIAVAGFVGYKRSGEKDIATVFVAHPKRVSDLEMNMKSVASMPELVPRPQAAPVADSSIFWKSAASEPFLPITATAVSPVEANEVVGTFDSLIAFTVDIPAVFTEDSRDSASSVNSSISALNNSLSDGIFDSSSNASITSTSSLEIGVSLEGEINSVFEKAASSYPENSHIMNMVNESDPALELAAVCLAAACKDTASPDAKYDSMAFFPIEDTDSVISHD
jgi:hypothetical protein